MSATIQSIQIGRLVTEGNPLKRDVIQRQWTTGFYKLPVDGPVDLTTLGLVGDAVADKVNHGGIDKAVLCYAAEHYPMWREEHPDLEMSAGALGENLTLRNANETNVCVGDRYQVGDCVVEVSQPRQPCWKIARRWGVKMLTKEVAQKGRTGWYLRVIETGELEAGQELKLLNRPNPNWTISRANDVLFGREVDLDAIAKLKNLPELADAWRESLSS
jgi:MOSC domain-containing protein YiiM